MRVMASGAQDVNHLDEVVRRPAGRHARQRVRHRRLPGGARALLDLCMFAEATHHQEELSVVGAARQGRGADPRRHDPRRPPRRALDRRRRVVPRRRPADRPRGPAPRVELPRARPLPRRRPPRQARRGDAGRRPVVGRHGRRRPPQHRARPPRRHVRVAARPRPVTPFHAWRPSHDHPTATARPVEMSWFSALCDDDYEFLGAARSAARQLVRALPQHRADRRPLRLRQRAAAVRLRPRHRQHRVRRGDGTA